MKILVVLAHPNADSFNHAIAQRACATLSAAGHDAELLDLYAAGVRAAMSPAERTAYHSDQPLLDPLIATHVELLRAAEALVFVYPTWWSSLPAILKGWFERVMVPGVGFVFDDENKVRPGLTNVQQLVGITTYGSKWQYIKTINDNGRRTVKRALRMSTGWGTKSLWLPLYGMDTIGPSKREAFLTKVERKVAAL